ncbi:MAG TPA: TOMM precursor leader peptide-binding protein [Actinomycetota bacterium]|jgi:ribosomal protein S12 methylthiotransferase accessory factor
MTDVDHGKRKLDAPPEGQLPGPGGRPVYLRPRYTPVAIEGEGLFLMGERDRHVFPGEVFADLLPVLTRGLTDEEIADALEALHPREVTHYALGVLRAKSLLREAPVGPEIVEDAFWDGLELNAATALDRLERATVTVTVVGNVDAGPVLAALDETGVRVRSSLEPGGARLQLVLTDDYLAADLAEISRKNLGDGGEWMLARPHGLEPWIGPLFRAGTGCWQCLAERLRLHRTVDSYLGRRTAWRGGASHTQARSRAADAVVARLVALEAAKWAAGHDDGPARVITFDVVTLATTEHHLRRRPQCPACGDPSLQSKLMIQPVELPEREQDAWSTASDLEVHVDRVTGTVTELVPSNAGDPSLHSYMGVFGFGSEAADITGLRNSFLSQASGVGVTDEAARIGAICEAIERHSGKRHGDEPFLRAAFTMLDPEEALHPNSCMLYSTRQYERREEINARGASFELVPEPFDETAEIDWAGVWSVTAGRFKLLPSTYLFYNHPQPPGGPYCWADSNGCAAGKTLGDAIRRGLYELVERDSVAVWWYNRLRRPRVDLASFGVEYFDRFVEAYRTLGREAWVLDITNDLDVPSFAAVSRSATGPPEDICVSFAADLDAPAAIEHALVEMNHLIPAVLPENRSADGDYAYPDPSQRRWWSTATVDSEAYLLPHPDIPPRRADDYDPVALPTHVAQVLETRTRVEARGLEVLVLVQTRPDVGVPVAKVIVPGLRHFWARFAPGRLYDVPVSMGWRDEPLHENDLNPIAMFV